MSSEYAIRALRDTANELRSKAAAHYAAKEIEARQLMELARRDADEMSAAAAEIDADADAKERQQTPLTPEWVGPCQACALPVVRDALGFRHADHAAADACPGPTPPVPAPPTLVDGSLDVSGQVDGTESTP